MIRALALIMFASHRRHGLDDATLELDRVIAPQVLVQRLALSRLSLDERITTAALGRQVVPRQRLLIVLSGRVRIHNQESPESEPLLLEEGDVFVSPADFPVAFVREEGETLDIEGGSGLAAPLRTRLDPVAETCVRALASVLRERADESIVQARTVEAFQALAASRLMDAELALALSAPTDSDELAYARSLDVLFNRLEVCPGTIDIERHLDLSRRTVTRRTHEFFKRHGLSGLGGRTDWRSIRDGYRLFVGVVLMSHPDATTARVARALGYGSAEALCHAFANVSLPTPTGIRERMRKLLAEEPLARAHTISQVVPALGGLESASDSHDQMKKLA